MARKRFVLREVIDIFHINFFIPTTENFSFHLSHVRILGSMECRNNRNDYFQVNREFY